MVKASAYGAGAVEIAKTLQDRGVDYLAVAVADEGAELRRSRYYGGHHCDESTKFRLSTHCLPTT